MADTLAGKVALVTGGNRGIGRAIAKALASAGANIAISYRTDEPAARETQQAIEQATQRGSLPIQANLSSSREAAELVAAVGQGMGTVDILVNNAGISQPRRVMEINEHDWDETLTVNLKSMFLLTQAVLPPMRARRWGRIINLSSVAAQLGGVVGPHYAASKAGILGLTHAYAALLAGEGITVNAIAPALIETDMVRNNPNARPTLIPVGRFGSVDEVAQVAVMLATNGYITGQTINVNGGWYMS
jgi:3-oxoacyl-[acyl-carrier protein] reductase